MQLAVERLSYKQAGLGYLGKLGRSAIEDG